MLLSTQKVVIKYKANFFILDHQIKYHSSNRCKLTFNLTNDHYSQICV